MHKKYHKSFGTLGRKIEIFW